LSDLATRRRGAAGAAPSTKKRYPRQKLTIGRPVVRIQHDVCPFKKRLFAPGPIRRLLINAVFPGTGGGNPRWRHDGKELFYLSNDNKIMVAAVSASGPSFVIGAITPLFETLVYRSVLGAYDVTADGERFIITYEPAQSDAAITLIENWDAELKRK
jgi:hypothetical protein